ncbi:MAG: hypothetical protein R3Y47_02540 [Lachnospiraceae bacterium]
MIKEDRVSCMTKLAIYEKRKGKSQLPIVKYFKGDYVSLHMIQAVVFGTLGFACIYALYVLYDVENFVLNLFEQDITELVQEALLCYVIFLISYCLFCLVVEEVYYRIAKKGIKKYFNIMKTLYYYYTSDNKKDKREDA